MAIFLKEEEIEGMITMPEAVSAVEESFFLQGLGQATNVSRHRLRAPGKQGLQVMSAIAGPLDVMGLKIYGSGSGGRNLVYLYSTTTGALLAIMDARIISLMRTGAASGVATKFLAQQDASTVGIIGTGHQAEAQLEAVCAVRRITSVRAYSRTPENRAAFADMMSQRLGVEVRAVDRPEDAVTGCDVVITITNTQTPVLKGEWLSEGTHINAAGGNALSRQELDVEAVRRSALIYTDSREQAKLESADLQQAVERGAIVWDQVEDLGKLVCGRAPGRSSEHQITLFESHGIALWDIAVGVAIYNRAMEMRMGTELPF